MLDIKWIRDNGAALDGALQKRNAQPLASMIIALDEKWRAQTAAVQAMQQRRNEASKAIGKAMGQKDQATADSLKSEVASLKSQLQEGEALERTLEAELRDVLAGLPNIPLDDVPQGKDENDNVEVEVIGQKPSFSFAPKEHFEIAENLGLMDFEVAAKLSGSRFTILRGSLARLERALGQFMLNVQTGENGYQECNVPLMVRDDAMFGTGQLPKFGEDLFRTTDDRWLIPTAEVPLTNMVRESILDRSQLPLRFTALTPCFRSEAGSAGRDTRGMLRQHQFMKVELVSITDEESGIEEHERMTACAQSILDQLGLSYRKLVLCTGDMGFGARKTYDLEVWLPGQDAYREISSCSYCGDFQGRRMNARYRGEGDSQTRFVHTLNGSGIAVGRALIAVIENYQNEDGSITVPEVLRPFMGGIERIEG